MHRRSHQALARAAAVVLPLTFLLARVPTVAAGTPCQPTGAVDRDGTPLTARLVNPTSVVRGRIDATGCEVGVYFGIGSGRVNGAEIFGARYYGVLVDGNGHAVEADVRNSILHDLGEPVLTAARHGQGIGFRGFGGTATGTASGNRIWAYQEAGINLTGPGTTATVTDNVITGRGAQAVISQNGVQVIHGAHGTVRDNRIADLRFLGPNVGNGVLVVGGPGYGYPYTRGTVIAGNRIIAADIGINIYEIEEDGSPSPKPTGVQVSGNWIANDRLTNLLGWDDDTGFQAGIAVYANGDRIVDNVIVGRGYDQATCGSAAVCAPIFTDGSIDPTISGNVFR